MAILVYLLPIALLLGALGLLSFLWALRSGQYDDLDGAAERVLLDDESVAPEKDEVAPLGRRGSAP